MSYIHWSEYYKTDFVKMFQKASRLKQRYLISPNKLSNDKIRLLCFTYMSLFDISCDLLKLYLINNGLFQFDNLEVLREAYYIEILDDGEIWMQVLFLQKEYKINGLDKVEKDIIKYYKKYFYIFERLNSTFKSLKEIY